MAVLRASAGMIGPEGACSDVVEQTVGLLTNDTDRSGRLTGS